jgi:hypothetical protein
MSGCISFLRCYVLLTFAQTHALFDNAPHPEDPIHVHELFAVLIAALSGLRLGIFIDNTTVVSVINKAFARGVSGPLMMQYVCELFWLSATHNFRLTAQYIHTKSNVLADTLSRGDFASFTNRSKRLEVGRSCQSPHVRLAIY